MIYGRKLYQTMQNYNWTSRLQPNKLWNLEIHHSNICNKHIELEHQLGGQSHWTPITYQLRRNA